MNDIDDQVSNSQNKVEQNSFAQICERRYSRRQFVKSGVAVGVAAASVSLSSCTEKQENALSSNKNEVDSDTGRLSKSEFKSNYDFIEIAHGSDQFHHVAPDHHAQILLRWGDPIFSGAPEFDPNNQTVDSQLKQFGYNNDYVAYLPLNKEESEDDRALLCVNHEYPIPGLMFDDYKGHADISAEQVAISQAAVGATVVEVRLKNAQWSVELDSKYNRRINAFDSVLQISGPAAGHPRMITNSDPSGKKVIGTFNNCAGGLTPWGTYLSCEENFNYHFSGKLDATHPEASNHKRYNLQSTGFINWASHDERFDVEHEPNEPNRFGWVVEIDPKDPSSTPKKRTALGRFKHEGAESVITKDGRLAVYMGDDQRFEYLYKFVSRNKVDLDNLKNNQDILDEGTLYVAKFHEQGRLEWKPLTIENKKLQKTFASQADILLEARRAADLLGATPLDRPEDVVPDKATGKVYVMLTNNTKRKDVDHGSPRTKNNFGHIIELSEANNDHGAQEATWDVMVKCGNPQVLDHDAQWNPQTSKNGWFASPDNGVFDPNGRLWISSDQGTKSKLSGTEDGLWALETQGELRGTGKMFFRAPSGAEVCGPVFSNDGENLFLAVQHPGDTGFDARLKDASTRWPDFDDAIPPRPALLVIRKKNGGRIA